MKVRLMVWHQEALTHQPEQQINEHYAQLENLNRDYQIKAIYTYPGLQQVDVYADRKNPERLPSPAQVAYQLDVEEAAHEENL